MQNLIDIRKANDFTVGNTYVENNYYTYRCIGKGEVFTGDFGNTYQEVVFSVRTKTGRELGTEKYKYLLS